MDRQHINIVANVVFRNKMLKIRVTNSFDYNINDNQELLLC